MYPVGNALGALHVTLTNVESALTVIGVARDVACMNCPLNGIGTISNNKVSKYRFTFPPESHNGYLVRTVGFEPTTNRI